MIKRSRAISKTYASLSKNMKSASLHYTRVIAQLCGHLVQTSLIWKRGSEYEALSYLWGDPTTTFAVVIDGRQLPNTRNFKSALQHLRLEEKPRTIWIDAICISQSDILEHNWQVRR
jgi:hypothetical protein